MAVVNVIVIHGIGELRKRGQPYSLLLQQNIRKHFGIKEPHALAFYEVDWSDIGDKEQRDLIDHKQVLPDATMPGAGTLFPLRHAIGETLDTVLNASEQARRFLLHGVGDVMVYLTKAGGDQIRQRLLDKILEVRDQVLQEPSGSDKKYVSIVAHSLGSVVTYDVCGLLGTRFRNEVVGLGLSNLFTLGSPLALFSLLEYGNTREHYAQRGVFLDRPDNSGVWYNFYDQQDPIAFPLNRVYPPLPAVPGRTYSIKDIRVQTGTFHAHTSYFANEVVARTIAKRLREDYECDR